MITFNKPSFRKMTFSRMSFRKISADEEVKKTFENGILNANRKLISGQVLIGSNTDNLAYGGDDIVYNGDNVTA